MLFSSSERSIMTITANSVIQRINELPVRNTATIRQLRRRIAKELAAMDRKSALQLAYELVDNGGSNGRWVAYELVRGHPATMDRITTREVERLGAGIS